MNSAAHGVRRLDLKLLYLCHVLEGGKGTLKTCQIPKNKCRCALCVHLFNDAIFARSDSRYSSIQGTSQLPERSSCATPGTGAVIKNLLTLPYVLQIWDVSSTEQSSKQDGEGKLLTLIMRNSWRLQCNAVLSVHVALFELLAQGATCALQFSNGAFQFVPGLSFHSLHGRMEIQDEMTKPMNCHPQRALQRERERLQTHFPFDDKGT